MAGYTGATGAKVDNPFVYLPIRTITGQPNRHVDVKGDWFQRMVAATLQPSLQAGGEASAAPIDPTKHAAMVRANTSGEGGAC